MQLRLLLFCTLTVCALRCATSTESDEYISLIASPSVYFNKSYKTFIATSEFETETDVILTFRKERAYFKLSPTQQPSINQVIDFKATDDHIYDDSEEIELIPLKISAHRNGKCSRQTVDIIDDQRQMLALIQLDKPVYKPNDVVQYRVVLFDDETKPLAISNISIIIEDSAGLIVSDETKSGGDGHEKLGLFKDSFQVEKIVNFGTWRIRARINGFIFAEKYFQVEDYQQPNFEVVVEHPEVVFATSKTFNVKIFGKYAFGNYANGVAKLRIYEINNGTIDYLVYEDNRIAVVGTAIKIINFIKDLKINILLSPKSYNMSMEFIDDASKSKQIINSSFTVKPRKELRIELINPPPLVPGMPYEIQVCIKNDYDEKIKLPEEFIHLDASIYEEDNDEHERRNYTIGKKLNKFILSFEIPTTENTTRIELTFTLRDSIKTYQVRVDHNNLNQEWLQLNVNEKNPKINQVVNVDINSSDQLGIVNLLVFGKFGIANSVTEDCGTQRSCRVQFKINKNMIPKAKILVHKVKNFKDKTRVGSTTIFFDESSDNNLKMQLSSTESQPKSQFKYTIQNEKNSYVAVLAIENSLTLNHKAHDITQTDIINALAREKKIERSSNDVFYDKSNHNYVLKVDLENWEECTDEEKNIFNERNPRMGPRTSNFLQINGRDAEKSKKEKKKKVKFDENEIRKDFPQTWIWDIVYFNNSVSESTFEAIVPDSTATWLFTAFSVNQDRGFALAEPQRLIVSKDFFIELNTPATMHLGEILKLELYIFNFVKEKQDEYEGTITVYANHEGKRHFKFLRVDGSGGSCTFESLNDNYKEIEDIAFKHNEATRVEDEELYIEALKNGKMSILVIAEMIVGEKKYSDTVMKEVEVYDEGLPQIFSETFEFRHEEHAKSLRTFPFAIKDVPVTSVEMTAVISSQIVGPAINFEDTVDISSETSGEHTCSKYARTLYFLDYLKAVGKDTNQFRRNAIKNINTGFQHLMRFKKQDGSFDVFFATDETSQGSTWMSAYTAKILGHSYVNKVNDSTTLQIIENALDYCIKHQQDDGSFKEVGYSKSPSLPLEDSASGKAHFTCFVLIALIKNNKLLSNKYQSNIAKGFEYVFEVVNFDNYHSSVCAYALALKGSRDYAKNILSQLETSVEVEGDTKHWDLNKGVQTSLDTKALIASYVALTYIELDDTTKFRPIMNWLVKNSDTNGNFEDSFSTAMAFEAFAAMGKIVRDDTEMCIKIMDQNDIVHFERVVTSENSFKPIFVPPLPKNSTAIKISAEGIGYVQVQTYFEYHSYVEEKTNVFELKVEKRSEMEEGIKRIRICANKQEDAVVDDMIVLQHVLPSGYVYNADRTNPMKQLSTIKMVETRRADTIVEFYLENLDQPACLRVFIQKTHEVQNVKKGSVMIYEYSRPTETVTTKLYDVQGVSCV